MTRIDDGTLRLLLSRLTKTNAVVLRYSTGEMTVTFEPGATVEQKENVLLAACGLNPYAGRT